MELKSELWIVVGKIRSGIRSMVKEVKLKTAIMHGKYLSIVRMDVISWFLISVPMMRELPSVTIFRADNIWRLQMSIQNIPCPKVLKPILPLKLRPRILICLLKTGRASRTVHCCWHWQVEDMSAWLKRKWWIMYVRSSMCHRLKRIRLYRLCMVR